MALNWDAFLIDEAFNIPNDQWPDITTPPTDFTSEMPKSSSTRTSGSQEPGVDFDSLLNGTSADPYFNDSLFAPNDYFLSDLEVLQPFGESTTGGESTSESSPEPSVGTALTGNSPLTSENSASFNRVAEMPLMQKPSISRANTFPNPQYESLFPNNLESGFVEDLTFPNGPNSSSNSTKTATENKASTGSTTKRPHKAKADILSACWTSPLCPNHDQDGPPPNPSSCGGGCAPFLFANDDNLPTSTISNLLNEAQEAMPEDGVVEIKSHSHSRKRSESDVSVDESNGRHFASGNSIDTEQNSKVKSESEDSPQARAEEEKAKPRRRLPHNQVERKYRESLNTQLESLRRVVPSLQQNQRGCDGADIEDLPAPSKPSKAVILASATAHIKNIEKDKKALQDENQLLKTRIKALQALVKCEDCSLMQYVMDLKINQQKG
ncbi:hypothetical protein DPSP01_009359 [Paraphaeosphaeria sporulosa]|uniref:BHLH domain-containing protein n=1 Tax=Paraphaeosphaeria sporulosa TaxID=1460663 RepID=A0A177CLL7_9PLEO|nr:uncharacterized protein CC84DRAFT_1216661 [Paraphaeosphaeria sporulosa]OAG07750.1 hypothetical protein CC84DRAFT_1216661 [Paraphaeosphaeria sporulosa]